MELLLETVALFSLKLAYESEGQCPILRDDLVMADYQRDVFELLVRRGDVDAIQQKVDECVALALESIGGVNKPLGRELQRLVAEFAGTQTMAELDGPLIVLKDYLKDIQ
ncbi:hypothetical protein DFS28_10653 [Pseudomonas sp. 478]|uniref:hypothetical protein n=1 Tax=unclassified Pseudomonas TaxID=196821 RepID=UPI000DAC1FD2|nr:MULTISPECIES: hypothetical protein [unclassified Pseudomonas]PZW96157.1 hypothetical protein DFS28_10653 [Pseudomonas sp. 478]TCV52721.1 hypothetical protein EDB99_105166 [Pseudomonas sp. 460]